MLKFKGFILHASGFKNEDSTVYPTVSWNSLFYLKAATVRVPLSEGFSCRRRREDDRWTVDVFGAPVFTSGAPVFTSGAPVFTSDAPVFTSGSTGSCFRLLLLLLLPGSALLGLGTGWSKLYKRRRLNEAIVKVAKMEYKNMYNMYRTYCDLNDKLNEGIVLYPDFYPHLSICSWKNFFKFLGREIQIVFLQNDERMNHEAFRKLCRCLVLLLSIVHDNVLSYI